MPKLMVIVASTRQARIGRTVADWVVSAAAARGDVEVDIADLQEIDLPFFDEALAPAMGKYEREHTIAWAERVGAADAFIIVSPEYNGSFPGSLKNALDFLKAEWEGKPAGIVGYGVRGGGRMITQLDAVLGNLGLTRTIGDLQVETPWATLAEDGTLVETDAQRSALETMLDQVELVAERVAA